MSTSPNFLYSGSEKYADNGDLLNPYLPEPTFVNKVDELLDKSKSAQYIATYLNDLHSVWTPHQGQVPVGQAIFYDHKRRVFVRCGRKWGKQIALDEIILTPKGFIRYGDLQEGDEVFDEQGKVQKVLGLSEINYSPEAYRVTFCNGESILACAEHRWLTYTKLNRKSERRSPGSQTPTVKTTREIRDTLMHGKEYNHSIPYTRPVKFPFIQNPIDPYLLGCWLGDGATHKAGITSVDEEILSAFRDSYGLSHYSKYDYGILGGFITKLRSLGVLGNKHIPHNYLYNSEEERLSLLQGLMDTDGTINKEGTQCSFDNTNKRIIDGVYFLVASLGMKPILHERVGKLNGVEKKKSWRIQFSAMMPVFRLKRKLERLKPLTKTPHHTIISVESVESVPMRCISVSGESHLYLIGKALIPTHNTELLAYFLYRLAGTTPGGQFYYVAPFYNQAAEIIWHPGRLKNFLGKHARKYIEHIYETDRRIVFKNGSFIKLVGSDNHQAGRGFNPDGAVYDEFKDHDYRFHSGFVDNLLPKKAPLLIVGTPPETFDHFFVRTEEDFKFDGRGAYFKMSTWTNPHIDKEELERDKQSAIRKGEWAKYMREIEAEIVPGGANAIFPMFEIPRYDEKGDFIGDSRHVKDHETLLAEVTARGRDYDYYMMWDPGSAITMACLLVAIHKITKKVIILDEVYETNRMKTSTKQVWPVGWEKAMAITKRFDWFMGYDHAAAWFANEVSDTYKKALTPCEKDIGEQKKENKLSVIKDFLLEDLYVVSKNCKNHISEMATYATDEHGKIPKKKDHTIDCIRYIFNAAGIHTLPKTPRTSDAEDGREESLEDDYDFEEDVPPVDINEAFYEFFSS